MERIITRATMLALALTTIVSAQDNFRMNASRSLFSDFKALSVGDAVTIIVVESSKASNEASTSTGRSSSLGAKAEGEAFNETIPSIDFGVSTNNEFDGGGKTSAEGEVKTRISATIDSVLSNGNLVVSGSRRITINDEEQRFSVKGVVRPADVQADNSVYSYNISNAEIDVQNDGMIDRNTEPGLLTRLFHWIF